MSAEVFKLLMALAGAGGAAAFAWNSPELPRHGKIALAAAVLAVSSLYGFFVLRRRRSGLRVRLREAFGLQEVDLALGTCPTLAGVIDGVPVEVQFPIDPDETPRVVVVATVEWPGVDALAIHGRSVVPLDVAAAYDRIVTGFSEFDAVVRLGGDAALAERLVDGEVRALLLPLVSVCGASLLHGDLTVIADLDGVSDERVPRRITEVVAVAKAMHRAARRPENAACRDGNADLIHP